MPLRNEGAGTSMSNRHARRADLARYRHDACRALLTFLVEPSDPALHRARLLNAAANHWLGALATRVRHCIVCSRWLVDRRDVGALLLSVPAVARPTSAGTAGVCADWWRVGLPVEALERACETTLQVVVPGGRLEPMTRR